MRFSHPEQARHQRRRVLEILIAHFHARSSYPEATARDSQAARLDMDTAVRGNSRQGWQRREPGPANRLHSLETTRVDIRSCSYLFQFLNACGTVCAQCTKTQRSSVPALSPQRVHHAFG
jgi:hypothetical protein